MDIIKTLWWIGFFIKTTILVWYVVLYTKIREVTKRLLGYVPYLYV